MKKLTKLNLGYVVGLIEGEGSINFQRRKKHDRRIISITIANINRKLLENIRNITEIGFESIHSKPRSPKHNRAYVWTVSKQEDCCMLLKQCLPYLIIKHEKATRAVTFLECRLAHRKREGSQCKLSENEKRLFSGIKLRMKAIKRIKPKKAVYNVYKNKT